MITDKHPFMVICTIKTPVFDTARAANEAFKAIFSLAISMLRRVFLNGRQSPPESIGFFVY